MLFTQRIRKYMLNPKKNDIPIKICESAPPQMLNSAKHQPITIAINPGMRKNL